IMPLIRANLKYRHLFGEQVRKDQQFENVPISRNAHDGQFVAVNSEFLAVSCESSGGGSFLILPIDKPGRLSPLNLHKICGHSSAIIDLAWNPFDDRVLATASEDGYVKLWRVADPSEVSPAAELEHNRRLLYTAWHPAAADVLLTASYDCEVAVWADCRLCSTIGHPDHVNSIAWSPDGRLLASTCKDRLARVMDPRSGCTVAKWTCHTGAKISKILFSDDCRLLTTGFSEYSQRQYALWDLNKTSRALHSDEVDSSSGVLLPYYDPDCSLLYLAGRGDGNIRFYEISRGRLHFLNQFSTHSPQKCIAQLPKRALDRSLCEVGRLYRLHVASNVVEPVRVIAPRRGHHVSDIYPPAAAPIPALGADQWLAGANRDPVRVSLSTGEIINPPLPPPQKPQSPPQAPQAQSSSSNGGDPTHQLTPGTLRNIQHLVQAASPPRPTLNSETAASTPADPAAAAPDTAATAAPAGTSCGPEKFSRLLEKFQHLDSPSTVAIEGGGPFSGRRSQSFRHPRSSRPVFAVNSASSTAAAATAAAAAAGPAAVAAADDSTLNTSASVKRRASTVTTSSVVVRPQLKNSTARISPQEPSPGGDASAAVSNSACGPTADMDSSSGRPDAVSTEELTSQLAAKDVELSSLRKELAFRDMRLMRLEKELQSKESELVYLRTLLRRYGDSRSSQC
ncbi:hypothetical protein BOX15_Mlig029098g2, partial [Macrostomum lignano]